MSTVKVRFEGPVGPVFAYLADPRNRPAWQPSLRAVRMIDDGPPRVGMRWVDITRPGVRPAMEITELEPDAVWAEVGTWAGVHAELRLRFAAVGAEDNESTDESTDVTAEFTVTGSGVWRPVGVVLNPLATPAVGHDLKRAAQMLATA